jgi:hypothetical protein
MRGGVLPAALLFAALGLALASSSRRTWAWSLAALAGTLLALSQVDLFREWLEIGFFGCWASIVLTVAAIYLPHGPGLRGGVALSVNAGFWAASVVSLSGEPFDVVKALPAVLLILPAAWLVARGASIAVKVASSWLIAIAILAATLPFLPVTPGYMPDHLE